VITVSAITIGIAALTFLWGFIDGMNREMVENTTRYFAGDVQVHLRGYHDDPTLDLAIANAAPVIETVRADPAVTAASVRMEGRALASRGDKSRGVMIVGVDPAEEAKVTDLFRAVVDGSPLDASATKGVLIGVKLAESLGLKPGDELILVGQAYDGSVASSRIPVRGVFETRIDELDGYVAVMPLEAVREFLAAPGGATAIVLRLNDRGALGAAQARLSSRLGERYEVVGWPTLLPMVVAAVRYHEVTGFVVLTIFFVVVAAGVANPVLMAVLERTREFGIMLAVGTSRARLLRLVLYEAMLLGLFGLLAGNALGLAVTAYFQGSGIDFSAFEAGLRTMPGLSNVVYPVVRMDRSVMISTVVFVTACLVALYPAAKAALLEPVAAIRGFVGRGIAGRGWATNVRLPVFVQVAARNILRNPRRTAITVGGTAFSIVAFVFLFGYYDGFGEQIIDNSTRYLTGHLQVERAGFRQDLAPELALEGTDALIGLLAREPGVAAAAPRIQAQALASSTTKSEGILLIGISPDVERKVTFIHQTIVLGEALRSGADREIVIGRELARKLDLRLGERMVVMAQAADGELGTGAYRISGIFATESAAFDGSMAFVTVPAAQSLLALGSRISTINIRLTNRSSLNETVGNLRRKVGEAGVSVVTWPELLPQIDEMVRVIGVMRAIVLGIVFTVTALAVMNTVFMAVAERTREFGVMMALGTPPGAVVRLVVYETTALMALASFIGYGVGALLVQYYARKGLDLSRFFEGYASIPGLTGISYLRLVVANIVGPGIVLFLATVLASLYPAARAAKLDPARAIRHA
jgi:ABC-type lipoprotein release transport system permease subunit